MIAAFDGFWVADFHFFLPSDASSITLSFSNFYADDRALSSDDRAAIANYVKSLPPVEGPPKPKKKEAAR